MLCFRLFAVQAPDNLFPSDCDQLILMIAHMQGLHVFTLAQPARDSMRSTISRRCPSGSAYTKSTEALSMAKMSVEPSMPISSQVGFAPWALQSQSTEMFFRTLI